MSVHLHTRIDLLDSVGPRWTMLDHVGQSWDCAGETALSYGGAGRVPEAREPGLVRRGMPPTGGRRQLRGSRNGTNGKAQAGIEFCLRQPFGEKVTGILWIRQEGKTDVLLLDALHQHEVPAEHVLGPVSRSMARGNLYVGHVVRA